MGFTNHKYIHPFGREVIQELRRFGYKFDESKYNISSGETQAYATNVSGISGHWMKITIKGGSSSRAMLKMFTYDPSPSNLDWDTALSFTNGSKVIDTKYFGISDDKDIRMEKRRVKEEVMRTILENADLGYSKTDKLENYDWLLDKEEEVKKEKIAALKEIHESRRIFGLEYESGEKFNMRTFPDHRQTAQRLRIFLKKQPPLHVDLWDNNKAKIKPINLLKLSQINCGSLSGSFISLKDLKEKYRWNDWKVNVCNLD